MGQLNIAMLSYRSNPHVGGQGIYLRHLSRELVALGHRVEVFSGQPYPELDPGVHLTKVPSLDLYAEPKPFRNPRPSEFRDRIDVEEWARMRTGAFPEPLTFARRVIKLLRARADEFDIVHDNQTLATPLLEIEKFGLPLVTTLHHPISFDRRIDLASTREPEEEVSESCAGTRSSRCRPRWLGSCRSSSRPRSRRGVMWRPSSVWTSIG